MFQDRSEMCLVWATVILSVGENGTRRYQLNIWSSWRGWRDKGEGREEGARRVVFQFGAILFVGDRWVLAVQKKRVFYVDMRVNDDCFVHRDVIWTGQHSCGFLVAPPLPSAAPPPSPPPLLAFCLSRSAVRASVSKQGGGWKEQRTLWWRSRHIPLHMLYTCLSTYPATNRMAANLCLR